MPSDAIDIKRDETCQVHGAPSRAAHRALWAMIAASLALIVWHVWAFGPSNKALPGLADRPFPLLLGRELWELLFDGHGILAELWDVLPYFIAGVLLAGAVRTYKIAVKLRASLRNYGFTSVFLASFVGILTPLCACGTLTTAVSLLFAGLPLAPVMSLLVTSPLMSPSTYLLTLNDLGPEWTVVRTIAAFSMGIFAGVVTHLLRDRGFRTETIIIEGAIPRGDFHDEAYPDERLRCNCKEKFGNRVASRTSNTFLIFLAKSSEMLWSVGKYVLVGVAVGAVVERYMPTSWIYGLFGRKDTLSILWVTLGSVPIFLHQISASSILYHIKSSLGGTMDNGAALAFMIGGPVTAMPTMVLFWTIFKKRVFALYLFVCVAGTLLIAYTFQFLVFVPNVDMGNPLLRDVRSLSGGSSAAIEKRDRNVRMVMDPAGKGLIATWSDDTSGRGSVVFDAGLDRFRNAASAMHDDRAYVRNVAEWLEEGNRSVVQRRILVYAVSAPDGKEAFSKGALAALREQGFAVTITDRRETPALSERLLAEYGQLWALFGGTGGGDELSSDEMGVLSRFTESGKSMLIASGPRQVGPATGGANQLAGQYGVSFAGSFERGAEMPVATVSYFFQRTSAALGSLLKVFHKA